MTDLPTPERFVEEYETICRLILNRHHYFDTVAIWLPRVLERHERDTIESLCGSVIYPPVPVAMPYQPQWQFWTKMHQPNILALEYLYELFPDKHLINQVHIAFDCITNNLPDAKRIWEFLFKYQVHLWKGQEPINVIENTTYYSARYYQNRNIVVRYADRPSRFINKPCCHIEWRINYRSSVRCKGIYTLKELIEFDHKEFWTKNFKLKALNIDKIGKAIIREPRRKYPDKGNRTKGKRGRNRDRLRAFIHVVNCSKFGGIPIPNVQEFIDNTSLDSRNYLVKCNADKLLLNDLSRPGH